MKEGVITQCRSVKTVSVIARNAYTDVGGRRCQEHIVELSERGDLGLMPMTDLTNEIASLSLGICSMQCSTTYSHVGVAMTNL